MNLSILLVGAAIGGFVIFALIRELRKSAKLETKLEINEAENEIITKQRDFSIDNVTDAISVLTGKKGK